MGGALLRVPIFPLAGALLFPGTQLPLHIFEPRYRAMIRDALASDRLIAMIQPREDVGASPALFDIGCIGRIGSCDERDDGCFDIVLEGLSRFRVAREADVETPYRQVDADREGFDEEEDPVLGIAQRAEVEREARRYADALGYMIEWEQVSRLDDEMLVNGIAQIAPLDVGSKQALLEASGLADRADLLVQFMQFQRMAPGGADGPETMQ
ncbi:MAG TPA: LON peptidase substrate-binding domain-containing protein [Allosphingosinicella sp.]|nr:LON peptidase substrate-binding domain-containing protein [Allosphingosinicella sp.]